jgi:hypothetical protein
LGRELEDVINDFQKLTGKDLAAVNAGLKKKKLEAIPVLAESDWRKKRESESGSSASAGMRLELGGAFEKD